MANHASHAALPYPIKGARYTLLLPYLDADGDPTDPTTPDTEYSLDDGAAADTAEEVASPKNSVGMLTLTGAETNGSCVSVAAKAASGPKTTLATIYPRALAQVGTGTLSAGSSGGGTLGTALAFDVTGCFIRTTGGTGGGGTGGAANQARRIVTYTPSTGAFTVAPNWETAPDNTTTYEVLLPEGVTLGMLRALNPTTAGRTLDVSSGGEAGIDLANVGSPTATLNLSGTTIKTATDVEADTADIQSRIPSALVGGRMDASVGAMAANTLTAAAIASGALDGKGNWLLASSNGSGLSAIPWNAAWDAEVQSEADDALEARGLTATRAGYLDKLNVSGLVASAADIAAITQAQRVRVVVPAMLERPDTGSTTYRVWIYAYDETHRAEDLDAVPVVAAENNTGTDRSSGLGTVTKPGGTTGIYYVDYTVADSHAIEGLVFRVTATEGAVATEYAASTIVVDTTAVDFTSADRAMLATLHDTRLTAARAGYLDELAAANVPADLDTLKTRIPGTVQPQTGDSYARLGEPAGASIAADVASVKGETASILARIGAFAGSGANTILGFFRALARSDVAAPSDLGGTFDPALAALQTMRVRGDAAWTTATGFASSTHWTAERAAKVDWLTGDAFARLGLPAGGSIAADIAAAKAVLDAAKVVTDRLATAIEVDGAVWRFTANALEQAPAGDGGGGGGATMSTSIPDEPSAGTMGEALAAALHWRLGKRVLVGNEDGSYTLRTYRAHAAEFTADTLWHEETLNHPTAPSEVTPA